MTSNEITTEWRERIGVRLMHAMKCTHDGDDFGSKAVCVTCFDNVQRVGAIVEAEVAKALQSRIRGEHQVDAYLRLLKAPQHPHDTTTHAEPPDTAHPTARQDEECP